MKKIARTTDLLSIRLIEKEKLFCIIPLLQVLNASIDEKTLELHLTQMIQEGYQCIGAFEGEVLIGICGFWMLTKYYVGKHIEPDNVIVHPKYQSQGVGAKLLNYLENFALQEACVASELNCYDKNIKAHQFWEKEGYEIIAYHFQKKLISHE